jgi:hypothetical protein
MHAGWWQYMSKSRINEDLEAVVSWRRLLLFNVSEHIPAGNVTYNS